MLVQSVRAVARGPVARLVAAGRAQHPRVDGREGGAAPGVRRIRHHRRVHGPGAGRLHRRSEEPGAGAGGVRTGVGGCRRGHRQPGGMPGAFADPRARHRRAARLLHEPLRAAAAGRGPQALARRVLPHRADPVRGRRDRACWAARCGWPSGRKAKSRMLQVEKRGRFITNMGFANFVTAAVESDDPRIKGTCMVILEETDPGIVRPRHAHAQAGASAFLHLRPDLQPDGAGQPHHRRLHGQGRRDRAALQPRRDHRSGLPPHARDGGDHDLGQAALGGRAGDPLRARPVPRRLHRHARDRRATSWACS